jgi:tetratricopeptide (TPR) repeat protein
MTVATGDGATSSAFGLSDLERMDPQEVRTLAYASAIGSEFDFDLLVEALGAEPEALAERIERLVSRGLLKERAGGGRFGFVDEVVRALVYQSMTESRLRVIHMKIAQTLERGHPEPSPEVVSELGRHFFLGKLPQKAWAYNRAAGRRAKEIHQLDTAIHHLERARLDLKKLPGEHTRELAEIEEELGDLQRAGGRSEAAEEAYLAALRRLPGEAREARARLLLARAELARNTTRVETARGLGEEALEISMEIGDLRGQAVGHRIRSRMSFERGDFASALDEAMVALDLLQRVGDREELGECCTDIALAFSCLGPEVSEDSLRWSRRAVEILASAPAGFRTCRAYTNLALAEGEKDPVTALEHLEQSRVIAERIGSAQALVRALLLGTEFRLNLGQVEEADREYQQAARILERGSDPRGAQLASSSAGMIAERRGQWEEAERAYRESASRAQELALLAQGAEAEFRLAKLLYKTRDLEGARGALQRSERKRIRILRPPLAAAVEELANQLAETPPTASPGPVSDGGGSLKSPRDPL